MGHTIQWSQWVGITVSMEMEMEMEMGNREPDTGRAFSGRRAAPEVSGAVPL